MLLVQETQCQKHWLRETLVYVQKETFTKRLIAALFNNKQFRKVTISQRLGKHIVVSSYNRARNQTYDPAMMNDRGGVTVVIVATSQRQCKLQNES